MKLSNFASGLAGKLYFLSALYISEEAGRVAPACAQSEISLTIGMNHYGRLIRRR